MKRVHIPLFYKAILYAFLPVRILIYVFVYLFWVVQFVVPGHDPEVEESRNPTILIMDGIIIYNILFNNWFDLGSLAEKVAVSVFVFGISLLVIMLLNAGDEL